MKKLACIFLAFFVYSGAEAQNKTYEVFYGVNLTQFHTGSGHGSSYVVNTNLQKGRKSLEMGIVYQDDDKRISGGDVKYKVFFGKNAFLNVESDGKGIHTRPYLHYNFIYHSTVAEVPDFVPAGAKKSDLKELPSSPGTIATMEHFTGIGMQLFLAGNFCLDGSMGLGAYIGSLDKYNDPGTIGIHEENQGFVLAFELGLGYKFGI